jgi:hypothetical protein
VAKNYAVTVKCPHGDADELLILRKREETLEQILNATWHFECPVHGPQRESPVGVREIGTPLSLEAQPKRVTARMPKASRRSKRVSLRVPVVVYGQNRIVGTFREETSTNLVSAHGGLVALSARVGVGETVLVVNKATQEEQECRVVYVGPLEGPKKKVGVALLRSSPNFWGLNFPLSISPKPTGSVHG